MRQSTPVIVELLNDLESISEFKGFAFVDYLNSYIFHKNPKFEFTLGSAIGTLVLLSDHIRIGKYGPGDKFSPTIVSGDDLIRDISFAVESQDKLIEYLDNTEKDNVPILD